MNKLTKRVKVPPLTSVMGSSQAERKRLSREVHDRIGQPLTVLKLFTERIIKSPEKSSQLLEEMRALITEMMADVRNLCLSLEPAPDNSDLRKAVLLLIEKGSKQGQLCVNFRHDKLQSIDIPEAINQAIISIVQESLANVSSHAGVNEATVKLWNTKDEIRVEIEDQGAGFDPLDLTSTPYGLASMQEAASLLSGKLTIESAPGVGTRVIAKLPLFAPAGKRK